MHTDLVRAWARTDRLFGLVPREAWFGRGIPLRHPLVFYVGHLPAFAWNQIAAGVLGRGPYDPHLDVLFARGIDPEDEDRARASAPEAWPAIEEVLRYRDGVRAAIPGLLAELPGRDDPMARWVGSVVLEHELMHHETLLYILARLEPDLLVRRAGWSDPPEGQGRAPRQVAIAAGPVTIGGDRDTQPFGWCNEFPRRVEEVPAFTIDDLPVSIGRYHAFVASGGYDEPRWWGDDLAWVREQGIRHPDAWRQDGTRWRVRSLLRWHELEDVSGWPVQVSLAEARAFARWAGRRLPSEAELHRAAYTGPRGEDRPYPWGEGAPAAEHGAFDFHVNGPVPVGSHPAGVSAWGVHELVGNGWEWTTTPFERWPGFEAHLRTYPGYSADFFGDHHFVVFGGSWCTDARLLRRTFRNWYQERYLYVFATFRTVAWRIA